MQQINFTENLDRADDAYMLFIFEEVKDTIWDFSQRTVGNYFLFICLFDSLVISLQNKDLQKAYCLIIIP